MTYTVIARKYRPETFDDVVGQDWISKTLSNAILKGRIAHAFLFSGPRGVGKTSMARILSKALNCVEGPSPTPCLKCEHCQSISRGKDAVDVVEIDAASNRGIDHIRALRENVRYVPVNSRFKIYIIDEVHMLTTESFNALLKTLEEPPEHVKFIFATTEPQKMPETVRSRCQCYDFRRITTTDIASRLEKIARAESIECESGVLLRIADLSRGGLRDAESLLDQISALGGGEATFSALNALTGRLSPGEVGDLVDAVLDGETARILAFVDRVFSSGTQGADLLKDLVDYLRILMLISSGVEGDLPGLLPGLSERGTMQAEKTDLDSILVRLQIAMETLKNIRWFDEERVLTEMALLKMARLSHTQSLSDRLESVARKPATSPKTSSRSSAAKGSDSPAAEDFAGNREKKTVVPSGPPPRPATRAQPLDASQAFAQVVSEVEVRSKLLASYLRGLKCRALEGDRFILEDSMVGGQGIFDLDDPENVHQLDEAARTALGGPYRFTVKKGRRTGQGDLPPIVQKSLERFEGDLL